MGAGIPTTPPITGDALTMLLIKEVQQLRATQEETNRLLRKDLVPESESPFMDPDAAALALGKTWTKSGEHRRCLKYFRDHGMLTIFGSLNPYTYSRDQVMALRRRIKAGKQYLP